jgi:uncharacterized pyridoxamine 5'-phosphate oxidase family protein
MFDYQSVLQANPNGVLATAADGKVTTRVFQYLFSDGNKVYFGTSSEKPVYAQLQANSYASFCTYPANFAPVVSVNGKVVFVDDIALKTRMLDENPGIKGIYGDACNPILKMFYIDVETVDTFDFAEGAKTYTL